LGKIIGELIAKPATGGRFLFIFHGRRVIVEKTSTIKDVMVTKFIKA
jgi:hypothetical protein